MVMYATIRSEKLKTGNVGKASVHNNRQMEVINSDSTITFLNESLIPCPDYATAIDAHIEKYALSVNPDAQLRKNSVLAQEFILSASPEYFRPTCPAKHGFYEEAKMQAWKDETLKFMQQRYGKHLIACELHLDEATPHIHAVVVPITPDGRLSAKEVFGRKELTAYQTAYADALSHLGLVRGEEHSKAKHQKISKFYTAINSPVPDVPRIPTPPMLGTIHSQGRWAAGQNKIIENAMEVLHMQASQAEFWKKRAAEEKAARQEERAKRNDNQLQKEKYEQRAHDAESKLADIKEQTKELKSIPLETILINEGFNLNIEKSHGTSHQYDGLADERITLDTAKNGIWYDHSAGRGGQGAIDLYMHISSCSFQDAKAYLAGTHSRELVIGSAQETYKQIKKDVEDIKIKDFVVPINNVHNIEKVRNYLITERGLSKHTVNQLIAEKRVIADNFSNCCFIYGNDVNNPSGVEKRGTMKPQPGKKPFKGFAGKKSGGFTVDNRDPVIAEAHKIDMENGVRKQNLKWAVCESAIEAMSYVELYPDHMAVSISGSGNLKLLASLIVFAKGKDYELVIATNNDVPGRKAALLLEKACKDGGVKVSVQLPIFEKSDWNMVLKRIKNELKDNDRELSSENIVNNYSMHVEDVEAVRQVEKELRIEANRKAAMSRNTGLSLG